MLTRFYTIVLVVLCVCLTSPAVAAGPTRTGVLDLTNSGDYPFNNFFKNSGGLGNGANWPYPSALDSDDYPNALGPSTPLPSSIPLYLGLPNDFCKYHWILDWKGSAGPSKEHYGLFLSLNGRKTPRGHVVATTGGARVANPLNFDLDAYGGTPGERSSIEFTMDDCSTGGMDDAWSSQFSFQFRAGGIFNQLKDLRLYRCKPDCITATAQVNASPYGGLNPDFIATVKDLNPGWLRMMGYQQTVIYNNLASFNYRPPITTLSFQDDYWNRSAWVGSIDCSSHSNVGPNCDTDSYFAKLPGVTPLRDGLTIQGHVAGPNNTNWPTLNLNGTGAKPIILFGGGLIENGGVFVAGAKFTVGAPSIQLIDCSGQPGSYVYDLTSDHLIGTIAHCDKRTNILTLSANSLASSAGLNDMLGWSNNMTTATSPFLKGRNSIKVSSCNFPGGAAGNVFDVTANAQVGTALTCSGTTLELSSTGSLLNSSGQGDVLTFGSGPFNNKSQSGVYTLFYNKYADAWLVDITGPRGIVSGVPLEVLVDIANATNVNLWINTPCFLAHDGSQQQIAKIVKGRLSPQLGLAVEYCNEVWNGSFPESRYAYYSAARWLGIGVENDNRGIRSWNAYQSKLLFDELRSVWGDSPRLYPIIAAQQGANEFASQPLDEFEGARLCPECGNADANAIYQSNLGSVAYNDAPNRAIDEAEFISIAPYFEGAQCAMSYGAASSKYDGLAKAADSWLVGDAGDAFGFLYADIMGSSGTTGNTLYNMMISPAVPGKFNYSNLQGWNRVARSMTNAAKHPVRILQYEGAMQCSAPPISKCLQMAGPGPIADQPYRYCGVNAPGFRAGDELTNATFPGLSYTITRVAPDGTPVAGTWSQPSRGPGSQIGAVLAGGSGYTFGGNYLRANITVAGGDGTISGGGKVTAITPYSGLIQGLIYAFKGSNEFESLMNCAYTGMGNAADPTPGCIVPGMMSYSSTAGVAQFGLSGGGLGAPWALFLQDIYGTRFKSYEAFKRLNGD